MKKTLFYKEYESPIPWGTEEKHKVKTYLRIEMVFNLKDGLWFCITAPNISIGDRNIFKAFARIFEHESIGMQKYQQLKDDTHACGLWKKLEPFKH